MTCSTPPTGEFSNFVLDKVLTIDLRFPEKSPVKSKGKPQRKKASIIRVNPEFSKHLKRHSNRLC